MMKRSFLVLLIPLLLSSLACALAVNNTASGPIGPCPEPDAPCVLFLAPNTGDTYALGTPILLHAQAQDSSAGVARIEFYDNFEALIGTVNASNPQGDALLSAIVTWQPPSAQTHFVYVQAFRADGSPSPRQEISVTVVQPPAGVSIPTPAGPAPSPTPEGTSNQSAPQAQAAIVSPPTPQTALSAGQGGAEAATVEESSSAATEESSTPADAAPTSLTAVVAVNLANVRVSPSLSASMAANPVTAGMELDLVFRSPDNQWAAITLPTGGYGWIFVPNTLTVNGDLTTLPTATP
jgi:hypothetical protein